MRALSVSRGSTSRFKFGVFAPVTVTFCHRNSVPAIPPSVRENINLNLAPKFPTENQYAQCLHMYLNFSGGF